MWATAEYSIHTFRRFSARWKVKKKKCSSVYLKHSRGVGNRFHVWHKLVEPHLVSLLLKEKRSNMTGGVYLCSPLSISHWAAQAWLTRKSPRQAENSSETPQLNPCWNIRASIPPPPRLAFQTVQGHLLPAPQLFKGSADAWGMHYGCILGPSARATPGRAFSLLIRFTPGGKPPPCNSDKESIQRHHELMIIKNHFGSHIWSEKVRPNKNTNPFLLLLSAFHYQILKWMKEKPELFPFHQCRHNKATVMEKKKNNGDFHFH